MPSGAVAATATYPVRTGSLGPRDAERSEAPIRHRRAAVRRRRLDHHATRTVGGQVGGGGTERALGWRRVRGTEVDDLGAPAPRLLDDRRPGGAEAGSPGSGMENGTLAVECEASAKFSAPGAYQLKRPDRATGTRRRVL